MKQVDVAIVGGGPAGMAAGIELAQGGADCVILDAYPQTGGHYFKQAPSEFAVDAQPRNRRQHEYNILVGELQQLSVTILTSTAVWSVFRETTGAYTLYLQGQQEPDTLQARYLLLAPGSYDRPVSFPGWHLPGVITPGAAQMLIKGHGIRPGDRALVAGSGPLLLAAAAGLLKAGTDVVAVLDAAPMSKGLFKAPRAFWGQLGRLKEAWDYGSSLVRKRVPLLFGHTVFRAVGDDEVTSVVYGKMDGDGRPVGGSARVAEVDTLCVALGFLPNLALTRHLGCAHEYDPALDAFYPVHNHEMETTVPNIFVAGDVTGIGGKDMAKLQGQIAALNILARLRLLAPEEVQRQIQALLPRQRKEARFISMIQERTSVRPALRELVDDETIICRCEMVRAEQIDEAVADGATDIRGVKLRTRCGMGACQGRYCEANVAQLIATATGQQRDDVGTMSVRPPLIPVSMGNILDTQGGRSR